MATERIILGCRLSQIKNKLPKRFNLTYNTPTKHFCDNIYLFVYLFVYYMPIEFTNNNILNITNTLLTDR